MTKQELEVCIRTYGRDIYSFCKQLAGSRQEADELYQDTFLRRWSDWKSSTAVAIPRVI